MILAWASPFNFISYMINFHPLEVLSHTIGSDTQLQVGKN